MTEYSREGRRRPPEKSAGTCEVDTVVADRVEGHVCEALSQDIYGALSRDAHLAPAFTSEGPALMLRALGRRSVAQKLLVMNIDVTYIDVQRVPRAKLIKGGVI